MEVLVTFGIGPFHVPLGRRKWTDGPQVEISRGGKRFALRILRPVRLRTHDVEGSRNTKRVVDANIPVSVRCELSENSEAYREVADVVLTYLTPLVEEMRARTRQPHLLLWDINDLEVMRVQGTDGQDIPELTRNYNAWIEEQEHDRPLPKIKPEDWMEFLDGPKAGTELSEWAREKQIPLYESLLLDAELESESDTRGVGVLFAALACEVFIQNWLAKMADTDTRLGRWLEWTDPRRGPEGNISAGSYYDIGLFLADGRSLRDNRELWNSLHALIRARNDIAHRGEPPPGYMLAQAIETARRVIDWVKVPLLEG